MLSHVLPTTAFAGGFVRRIVVAALGLLFLAGGPARGQGRTAGAPSQERDELASIMGLAPLQVEAPELAHSLPALRTIISVELQEATLEEALRSITEAADLRLVYGSHTVAAGGRRVTLDLEKVTAREALERVLRRTGLGLLVLKDGQVVITEQPEGKSLSAAPEPLPLPELVPAKLVPARLTPMRQQTGAIAGTVTDSTTDEPLPGVNVVIAGTQQGAATDAQGHFTISDLEPGTYDLVASFVGYATKRIDGVQVSADETTTLNIMLQSTQVGLGEVVVVGYSQKTRGEITGSVVVVDGQEIVQTSANNITQAIQGKMPGVIVNSRGGGPGTNNANIIIRGQSTLGDDTPLIVINGIPRTMDDFAHLSPNAIASISVLKDASAAIYGARAANGVILITTKSGRPGEPVVQLNSSYGVQSITNYPNAMTTYQRVKYWNEMFGYDGLIPLYTQEELEHFRTGDMPLAYPSTDWAEVVLSDFAPKTHHNLSISGGTENIVYYLSGDYLYEGGQYKSGDLSYNQFQVRANLTSHITDNLTLGANLLGRQGKRHSPNDERLWFTVLQGWPWLQGRWPNGTLGQGLNNGNSPITDSYDEYGWVDRNTYTFNSILSFEYEMPWLLDNLSLSGYASFDFTKDREKTLLDIWTSYSYNAATDTFIPAPGHAFTEPNTRQLWINDIFSSDRLFQLQLSYEKTFGLHTIDGFVAYEQSQGSWERLMAYRRDLPSSSKAQLYTGSQQGRNNFGTARISGRVNYFGSVSYDYAQTYLLDFSLRYDGSFNFPPGSRFGLFPAVSAGWILTNEPFLNSTEDWLNQLKLRVSWGKTGNDRVPSFQYLARYAFGGDEGGFYAFGIDPQALKAFGALSVANPNITWEKSYKANIGIDIRAGNGLLNLTVDVFHERRRDILVSRAAAVPTYTAISLPDENIGKVNSQGFELSLFHNNTVGSVHYEFGGNLTYYTNEIVFMAEAKDIPEYQEKEGHPIESFLVYKADGLFNTQEEIDSYPHMPGTRPGDIKYIDINGDGQITGADRFRKYTSPIPKVQYGFSASLGYKNLTLDLFFQGQAMVEQRVYDDGEGVHIQQIFFEKRWTPENPDRPLPRAFRRDDRINAIGSTFWLDDASFLRLKNARISYTLPDEWLSKLGVSNVSAYISGRNLLTWETFFGQWDPERPDDYYYPQLTTYTVGTNIRF